MQQSILGFKKSDFKQRVLEIEVGGYVAEVMKRSVGSVFLSGMADSGAQCAAQVTNAEQAELWIGCGVQQELGRQPVLTVAG